MLIFFFTFFPLLLYLDNVLHIICKYESNTHFVLVCNPSFVCSVYCGFFSRQCAFAWRTQWTEPFIPFTTIYQFLPRFFFLQTWKTNTVQQSIIFAHFIWLNKTDSMCRFECQSLHILHLMFISLSHKQIAPPQHIHNNNTQKACSRLQSLTFNIKLIQK